MQWNGFEQAVRAGVRAFASLAGLWPVARVRLATVRAGNENDLRSAGAGAALAGVLGERDLV